MGRDRLRGLYAVTEGRHARAAPPTVAVRAALEGGARIVQYRDKTSGDDERVAEARALLELCGRYGALFLVNDDPRLARAVGADGVHLGQGDMPVPEARAILGATAVIGVTCHDRLDLALQARSEGADYVAFGAFFPSATKPEAPPAPLDLIACVKAALDIPVCAIGGITADNAPALVAAGADMIAVSAALFGAEDIVGTAGRLQGLFGDAPQKPGECASPVRPV